MVKICGCFLFVLICFLILERVFNDFTNITSQHVGLHVQLSTIEFPTGEQDRLMLGCVSPATPRVSREFDRVGIGLNTLCHHGNLRYPPKLPPPINKALLRDY